MQTGSKEFDLLCACAGVEISKQHCERILAATKAGVDWKEFLRLAEHHGAVPLVARTLRQQRVELPDAVRQKLEAGSAENLKRNLWFASELARILHHFEKRNLTAIPYKGPVLAESAYGDLALRSFADLDFLISSEDFDMARQALAELDYRPSESLTPALERFWLQNGYECAFDGKAGKYLVELQWALLPRFYAVDLRNEALLKHSTQARFNGREIRTLSPEDSLLVLSLHAAKHLWMRLIWLCDIAQSIRTQAIDYSRLLNRAHELGVLRMVSVSFWLAANLLDMQLTAKAQEVVAADRELPALGKILAERLARTASYDFESPQYFLLIRKLRERPADRWRYLWRLIWTPGVGDLAAIRLPSVLFPLYRIVRLARLARRLFPKPAAG